MELTLEQGDNFFRGVMPLPSELCTHTQMGSLAVAAIFDVVVVVVVDGNVDVTAASA